MSQCLLVGQQNIDVKNGRQIHQLMMKNIRLNHFVFVQHKSTLSVGLKCNPISYPMSYLLADQFPLASSSDLIRFTKTQHET